MFIQDIHSYPDYMEPALYHKFLGTKHERGVKGANRSFYRTAETYLLVLQSVTLLRKNKLSRYVRFSFSSLAQDHPIFFY
jgi:hypothetical protein